MVMTAEIANSIRAISWLADLPSLTVQALNQVAQIVEFKPGQMIGKGGEQLNYLLSVMDGVVQNSQQTHEQKLMVVSEHGPGSTIGWLSAIDQKPLNGTLVAKTQTKILLLPMATVRAELLNQPNIIMGLLSQMSALIRKHEEERRLLLLPNAFQRIYLHILNLAQSASAKTQEIRLPNQGDIAINVNTSRETVSRAIQQLLKQGVITKQGHRIQVQQPEMLKKLAEHGIEHALSRGERA